MFTLTPFRKPLYEPPKLFINSLQRPSVHEKVDTGVYPDRVDTEVYPYRAGTGACPYFLWAIFWESISKIKGLRPVVLR